MHTIHFCWRPFILAKFTKNNGKPIFQALQYQDLVEAGEASGYSSHLLTLEVGSRGMVDTNDFYGLAQALRVPKKDIFPLGQSVIWTTILESFTIWGSRNTVM